MRASQADRGAMTRRDALRVGAGAAGGTVFAAGLLGPALTAMAAPAVPGVGPYGPLRPPDANGVMLPQGFASRVIARVDQNVGTTSYKLHGLPDGMGTFRTKDGGFILVSNSELPYSPGNWEIGAAAIRFNRNFAITDAYPILKKTGFNCAGGVTPWGTWLSCEETEIGQVFECDPWGRKAAKVRPAMGKFKHEAAVIDPVGKHAFLTEDLSDGCFYRFRPDAYPDLSKGKLDVAVELDGKITWHELPDPGFSGVTPTRKQIPEATPFHRGEGAWYDDGIVYFATTSDDRVYAYHCADEELEVLYDRGAIGASAPLDNPDNVTVSPVSGDVYVCEDGADHRMCLISTAGEAATFLELPGPDHANSELTGPAFDPTGHRLYFSSQHPKPGGMIFEITGPFRRTRPEPFPDRSGPVVKVRVLGRPSMRRLITRGQTFRLIASDEHPPMKLETKLLVRLKRANGKGSREVTVGQTKVKLGRAGSRRIRMRPDERLRRRLGRQKATRGRLIVTATDHKGNRSRTVKRVRFG